MSGTSIIAQIFVPLRDCLENILRVPTTQCNQNRLEELKKNRVNQTNLTGLQVSGYHFTLFQKYYCAVSIRPFSLAPNIYSQIC